MALNPILEQRFQVAIGVLAHAAEDGEGRFTRRELHRELNRPVDLPWKVFDRPPFALRTFNRFMKEYQRIGALRKVGTRSPPSTGRPAAVYRVEWRAFNRRLLVHDSVVGFRADLVRAARKDAVFPIARWKRGPAVYFASLLTPWSPGTAPVRTRRLLARFMRVNPRVTRLRNEYESFEQIAGVLQQGEVVVIGPQWRPGKESVRSRRQKSS